jgi:hypothetical protein
MTQLKCTFLAQEWIGDTAYPILRENPPSWFVTVESLPEPFSCESDNLRFLGDSPQWVRDWSGPFEVDFQQLA